MTWFGLSLLAAVSFASVNIADKFLLLRYAKTDAVAIKALGLFSALVAFIMFAASEGARVWNPSLLIPIAAGFFEIAYIFYYLKAIEKEVLAYLIPIFSLAPVVEMVIARVWFGESVRAVPTIGILVTILGVVLLVIAKEGRVKITKNRAVAYMLASTALFGLSSLLLDRSLASFSLYDNLLWSRFGVFLGALVISALTRKFHVHEFIKREPYMFVISEILYLLTIYLFIRALAVGEAAYVLGIANIQPLFVFLFTYVLWRLSPTLLNEDFHWQRRGLAVVSILVIVLGSWFMNW